MTADDKFLPVTSEFIVATKSRTRYFDLDAVREAFKYGDNGGGSGLEKDGRDHRDGPRIAERQMTHAGAPPLDWWKDPAAVVIDRLIRSMCPEKVCTVCGEPSRRIVEHLGEERRTNPPTLEDFSAAMRKAMEEVAMSHREVAAQLGVDEALPRHYLGKTGKVNHQLPSIEAWKRLDALLPFDCATRDQMSTVEPEYETEDRGNRAIPGRLSGGPTADDLPKRVATGWSDCGHDSWRPGITFDPFAQVAIERTEDGMTSRFIIGDTRAVLATMPDNSVDLIISSPPFLALRSYLPADHPDKDKEIGSEPTPGAFLDTLLDIVEECARVLAPHGSLCIELGDTYSGSGGAGGDYNEGGLRDGQPVFRQDANGNRYRGYSGGSHERNTTKDTPGLARRTRPVKASADDPAKFGRGAGAREMGDGVVAVAGGPGWPEAKSLCLIPQSFAWALSYGRNPFTGRETERWRVRNIVRWCRPNPPVGALGDKYRPATSEMVVATKARDRYFDLDAVREPYKENTLRECSSNNDTGDKAIHGGGGMSGETQKRRLTHAGAPPLDWWEIATSESVILPGMPEASVKPEPAPKSGTHRRTAKGVESVARSAKSSDRGGNWASLPELGETGPAPPLDYWVIPTEPYKGSHYATFPEKLVVKPIKSMCPERVCTICGEPSRRIVGEAEYVQTRTGGVPAMLDFTDGVRLAGEEGHHGSTGGLITNQGDNGVTRVAPTLGWSDCGHDSWRRGITLDIFAGSGTTLAVAEGLGRDSIGIDLDARNAELAQERCGMFLTVEYPNSESVA